jgi:hypothetical protein
MRYIAIFLRQPDFSKIDRIERAWRGFRGRQAGNGAKKPCPHDG